MGMSMPKFVTDSYTSVRESYYNFKNGVKEIKETFQMAKTAFKMARSLDTSKFAETRDPKDIINAMNDSGTDIPESYKSIMSMIPEDTLKKLTNILFESLSKNKKFCMSNIADTTESPCDKEEQRTSEQTKPNIPDFSNEDISEAIERMTDAIPDPVPPPESGSRSPLTQQDYIDVDPPPNINYNPGYSEMKSDDERETRFNNDDVSQEETLQRNRDNSPFGMENNFNYRPASVQDEQPSVNPGETSPFGSTEHRYYRPRDKDQSSDFSFQNQSASPYEETKKDIPPMTKRLGEELEKKFGPYWRNRVPSFVTNPEISENIPDLGLGLSKENNKDMVTTMSRVLKDLL